MISAVAQCEMYHVNLILHQSKTKIIDCLFKKKRKIRKDMSPSIGTPPRFIQPPSINDSRLLIPSLTQNTNNKWDPLLLSESKILFLFHRIQTKNWP